MILYSCLKKRQEEIMREKALFTNRTHEGLLEVSFGNIVQDIGPSPGGLYEKALQNQQQYLQMFSRGRG